MVLGNVELHLAVVKVNVVSFPTHAHATDNTRLPAYAAFESRFDASPNFDVASHVNFVHAASCCGADLLEIDASAWHGKLGIKVVVQDVISAVTSAPSDLAWEKLALTLVVDFDLVTDVEPSALVYVHARLGRRRTPAHAGTNANCAWSERVPVLERQTVSAGERRGG